MVENIPAKELDRYVDAPGSLIVDLRSQEEYEAGHIRGAVNVPMGDFEGRMPSFQKELILYCQRGGMSMAAARELSAKGYRVKTVVGGFLAYRGNYVVKQEGTRRHFRIDREKDRH